MINKSQSDTLLIKTLRMLPTNDHLAHWSGRITENSIVFRNSYKLQSARLDGKQYVEFALHLRFDKLPIFKLTFASGTRHKTIVGDIRQMIDCAVMQIEKEMATWQSV